jgi:hypothetical protein
MDTIWEFLKSLVSIRSLIVFIILIISEIIVCYFIIKKIVQREIRIYKNHKRKIYFFKTQSDKNLQNELLLIKQNNLFIVDDEIKDLSESTKILDNLEKFSIFVLSYFRDFNSYEKIIDLARNNSIPVIVLASPREINDSHMKIFNSHSFFEMCNTPARLLTILFNLSIITPIKKK